MSTKRSRVYPPYKTKYRVTNGASYNETLVRRGHLRPWISPDATAILAALVPRYSKMPQNVPSECLRKRGKSSDTLGMNSRVHPKYKTKYRVSNWAEYDRALVQRGDITLWISADAADAWSPGPSGERGGQRKFSDQAIETTLIRRLVF